MQDFCVKKVCGKPLAACFLFSFCFFAQKGHFVSKKALFMPKGALFCG